MGLTDEIKKDFQEEKQEAQQRQDAVPVFESVEAVIAVLSAAAPPRRLCVEMCLLTKEAFDGGWTVWLTSKELKDVLDTKASQINALSFEKRAKYVFRLTVWDSKKRDAENANIDSLPVGTVVRATRVTGLHLFKDKLAQNTNHIDVVSHDATTLQDGQDQKKTSKRAKRTT